MADDCIFCKIIKGEIPSFKIYEDGTIFNGTTYVQGDDEVAFAKWINNYFHDKNGFRVWGTDVDGDPFDAQSIHFQDS